MKKKILSLILVAAMLASMLVFVPAAGATESAPHAVVDVQDAIAKRGEQVTVDVVIALDAKDEQNYIMSFNGVFEYDKTRLEFVKVIRTDLFLTDGGKTCNDGDDDFWLDVVSTEGYVSAYAVNSGTNAINGEVAFQITFNVKEDAPVGDAFVTFRYVDDRCQLTYDAVVANYLNKPGQVDYLAGNVTVLSDGYNVLPSTEGMEFTNLGNGQARLDSYYGDATELIIPEYWYDETTGEILAVTTIAPFVFCTVDVENDYELIGDEIDCNETVEKIVISAKVTTIEDYAFINGDAVAEIIVLGTPTIGVLSLGTTGAAWRRGSLNTDDYYDVTPIVPSTAFKNGGTFDADTVLKGVDVAVLEAYNATVRDEIYDMWLGEEDMELTINFPIEAYAPASATLTLKNGEKTDTYFVYGVDAVTAPEGFANVVVWKDAEGTVYAPGADLGDTTEITAVVAEAPTTNEGVTMKPTTDDLAMRFTANISKATYDTLAALGKVEVGMLITPRKYVLGANKVFTMEALGAWAESKGAKAEDAYVKVPVASAYKAYLADGTETTDFDACASFDVAASIQNFSENTVAMNPEFVSIAYMTVTLADGAAVTVYGDFFTAKAQSVGGFLANLTIPDDLGDGVKGAITEWKKKFGIN